ncbi:MAG: LysR family transcriptional regulator [Tildeniella nuda ZEHNDER 1965/U140]|jgi:DNA-binding transcriptional LysR family regulator|nr:LysR family transcriptional regulator [Tildeniella nuda ZEHNDER 1965/U140]
MNLSQLKLSQLRILVAVAEAGSFSEAALTLHMSQSAVSYAIATLEDELGIVLLTRGRYGSQITPVGEQIVARAREMLQLMDDIIKQANLAKGLDGGHLRISTFRSAGTHILPDVLADYCQRYPAIAIDIREYNDRPEVEDDLRKGRSELGITYLPVGAELKAWELMRDEFVVLFPPGFELASPNIEWAALMRYPLIMAPVSDGCDAMVYAHCATYGITLHATYQIRSDATIVNMVAKGLGAAISPRLAAEPIPSGVKVYSLPVPLFRVISVAILAEALLPPAAFAFLELLKRTMSVK